MISQTRFSPASVSVNKMIDSHCHINDELYIENPAKYVDEAKAAGVSTFLVVGFDLKSSKDAVKIAKNFPECYAAVGIHPSDVKKAQKSDFEEVEKLAKEGKVIAIGEIGLDYYWDKDPEVQKEQKEAFKKQIEIANRCDLPISIHCRDAIEDCLTILKENPVKKGGIMHCYAGSLESAREFIKLGFALGFGGTTTFKNSVKPKDVAKNIDENWIVLETDSPYLTPVPFRGQPNHSKYLCYIRDEIASLRGVSKEKIEELTDKNFKRIFSL